jgi:hypothetical protein
VLGIYRFKKLVGIICGEEWAGSLDKIMAGRSKVVEDVIRKDCPSISICKLPLI